MSFLCGECGLLAEKPIRQYWMLSSYLVPILRKEDIEEGAEELLLRYCPNAVTNNEEHTVSYDEFGNVAMHKEKVGGSANYETTFEYDVDNRPTALRFGADNRKINYAYDRVNRISTRTVVGAANYATTYTYLRPEDEDAFMSTPLVQTITQNGQNFSYTYDNVGNISSVTRNGLTTTYAYDNLGQLARVNDPHASKSTVYTYDRGGNITSYSEYAYTTGTLGTATRTVNYVYSDTSWKDKVTSIDGKQITYDAIGNPLTYDGWMFTWKAGRMLASMVKSGSNVQFTYDHNGLRVKKVVNDVTTNYTLNGKKIVHMTQGSNDLHFFYDAQNKPSMVHFNGVDYFYVYNLQGDVVAMIDATGSQVVEYVYDAWGVLISKSGSMAATLGTANPFRYRGYVYDEETGLYYLKNRYYDPAWKRFINADAYLANTKEVFPNNQFAYCVSSPVMRTDTQGAWSDWFTAITTVVTSVAIAAAVIAAAPVIAGTVGSTAILMGAASMASAASTAANVACITVATMTVACGVNRGVEDVTGENYGTKLLGEEGYETLEAITFTSAALIATAPNHFSYPSTGRTQPQNLKEQMLYQSAIEGNTQGAKMIMPYLKDTRMPGWMGWQKYELKESNVIIHFVKHRYLPVSFDFKFK